MNSTVKYTGDNQDNTEDEHSFRNRTEWQQQVCMQQHPQSICICDGKSDYG